MSLVPYVSGKSTLLNSTDEPQNYPVKEEEKKVED